MSDVILSQSLGASSGGGVPIGSVVAFPPAVTANTVVVDGATYLRSGVVAPAAGYSKFPTEFTLPHAGFTQEGTVAVPGSAWSVVAFGTTPGRVSDTINNSTNFTWSAAIGANSVVLRTYASGVSNGSLIDISSVAAPGSQWSQIVTGQMSTGFVPILLANNTTTAVRVTITPGLNNWSLATETLPLVSTWVASSSNTTGGAVVLAGGTSQVAITRSTGGVWTQRTLPASARWTSACIVSNGNNIVAVAEGTTAATSSDGGVNWIQRTLPVSQMWRAVGIISNVALAVAANSNIAAFSTNSGATWTQINLPVSAEWAAIRCSETNTFHIVAADARSYVTVASAQVADPSSYLAYTPSTTPITPATINGINRPVLFTVGQSNERPFIVAARAPLGSSSVPAVFSSALPTFTATTVPALSPAVGIDNVLIPTWSSAGLIASLYRDPIRITPAGVVTSTSYRTALPSPPGPLVVLANGTMMQFPTTFGSKSSYATSTNGIDWTARTLPTSITAAALQAGYAGPFVSSVTGRVWMFAAQVIGADTGLTGVWTEDGVNWTAVTFATVARSTTIALSASGNWFTYSPGVMSVVEYAVGYNDGVNPSEWARWTVDIDQGAMRAVPTVDHNSTFSAPWVPLNSSGGLLTGSASIIRLTSNTLPISVGTSSINITRGGRAISISPASLNGYSSRYVLRDPVSNTYFLSDGSGEFFVASNTSYIVSQESFVQTATSGTTQTVSNQFPHYIRVD